MNLRAVYADSQFPVNTESQKAILPSRLDWQRLGGLDRPDTNFHLYTRPEPVKDRHQPVNGEPS